MVKIGINGMGRIGRIITRRFATDPPENIELVAANDLFPPEDLAYLMRYDSVHGRAPFEVAAGEGSIKVGDREIELFREQDPADIPWKEQGVDIVLECTGLFRDRDKAAKHLKAGASKVILSAPSDNADLSIVMGVNEEMYEPKKHDIVSATSCTTNSLAPVAKVLNDQFGIENLMATTVHAYTSSQKLVDSPARKRRRGRAASVSLVPTSTGAARATAKAIPELEGKMHAVAIRAPVPDGAITDITALVKKDVTAEAVNDALKAASFGRMKGVMEYSEDELVSADIITDPASSIIDSLSTKVVGRTVKVLAWYDNEYGFSCRMLDLAAYIAGKGGMKGEARLEAPVRT
ncbi:type I glyceraldehyde-3-phosphate dehydrogenase [Methanomassiliicoccus luminyensis]|jgi:glyceraldehyde-3-phosphate dehydrogenase type I|uniref:type I glyceraldehyde-3-phosphate dehydrogenase n=1 Tax=Methanomassiliicoccus luminyensis TaxID=1080712 RepID=UPI00037568F7|nr:type I glyceraldehyde-3-phosphate dehydrogenase [Methanomassiliicoccus luminyensis]